MKRLTEAIIMWIATRYGPLHVCADCGGLIFGEPIRHNDGGATTYYHVHRCDRQRAYRPMRGVPFPWTRNSFRMDCRATNPAEEVMRDEAR
jgi:hypothetical protein